jgi:hypothetical protein
VRPACSRTAESRGDRAVQQLFEVVHGAGVDPLLLELVHLRARRPAGGVVAWHENGTPLSVLVFAVVNDRIAAVADPVRLAGHALAAPTRLKQLRRARRVAQKTHSGGCRHLRLIRD